MEKIKVLLCDDMDYLCQYFELLLNKEDDIEVVGTASDPKTCIELYREKKPDVTLLDIQMQTDDEGIKVLEMIIEENPNAKVIMLTIHEEDDLIFRALSSGACDYIIKSSGNKIIADSVRRKLFKSLHSAEAVKGNKGGKGKAVFGYESAPFDSAAHFLGI